MSDTPLTIPRAAARRFLVDAFALDDFQSLPDVPSTVERLEFVQEDSINVCGRIHDLILWARVRDYIPADLHRTLYAHPRQAFEYYFPNLCVLPIRDYPYFTPSMQARAVSEGRWHRLTEEELPIAERLLAVIDSDGPLRTRSTGADDGHALSGWGTRTTVAARVIEKLWLHGRLTVSHRENFERWFDRTERLLPHVGGLVSPETDEIERFKTRKRLRARRLFKLKAADRALLGATAFRQVTFADAPGKPWYILAEDAERLQATADVLTRQLDTGEGTESPAEQTVHFLAPLDPLIYDRERNRALWDFDYTWEVYTPAVKRQWGYYVLPILQGNNLIGRIDPKIDRKTGTLNIVSLTFEAGVDKMQAAPEVARRLAAYGRFLGAVRIDLPAEMPKMLRRRLEKHLK